MIRRVAVFLAVIIVVQVGTFKGSQTINKPQVAPTGSHALQR